MYGMSVALFFALCPHLLNQKGCRLGILFLSWVKWSFPSVERWPAAESRRGQQVATSGLWGDVDVQYFEAGLVRAVICPCHLWNLHGAPLPLVLAWCSTLGLVEASCSPTGSYRMEMACMRCWSVSTGELFPGSHKTQCPWRCFPCLFILPEICARGRDEGGTRAVLPVPVDSGRQCGTVVRGRHWCAQLLLGVQDCHAPAVWPWANIEPLWALVSSFGNFRW